MEQVRLIKHQSYTRAGIILSSLMLVAFAYGLLCPPVVTNSYADSNTDAVVTEAGVNVGSMISIALDPSIDIDVMPSSSTVYDKKAAKLTVTTNNSSGYSLYMQTLDDTANLTSDDLSNTTTIAPLAKASILEQFDTNTWGYNLGRSGSIDKDRIYYPVPTTSTTVMETGGTSYRDEYDLTFGVAVSNNLPVGRYSNSVMISAVANPTVITSLNQAQYMQTMNKELCQNTDYGVTKQLIDIRDGKKYWVARLLDGNCWMTQNLALTLKDFGDGNGIHAMTENGDMGSKLTSSNTDITDTWDEDSQYPPSPSYGTPQQTDTSSTFATNSWNLGKYVMATPMSNVSCGSSIAALASCTKIGLVNVEGEKFATGFEATIGNWGGASATSDTLIAVNCTEWEGEGTSKICTAGTYDERYLVGNYYQWNTATAGRGVGVTTNTSVIGSICPNNWKLPLSTTANNEVSGSFYNLLDEYGLVSSSPSTITTPAGYPTPTFNIYAMPLYYLMPGYVASGVLTGTGSLGFFFSNSSTSTGYLPYHLRVNGNSVFPSRFGQNADGWRYDRNSGASVRCVIR